MLKVSIHTNKQKNFSIYTPFFLLDFIISIAFSKTIWTFVSKQTTNKTIQAIYPFIPAYKDLGKSLTSELRHTSLPFPLVDFSAKDGTAVKVFVR